MDVITSSEEFIELRLSDDPALYDRAAYEEASLETWRELIRNHEEMRFWVAHNKTVPIAILEELSDDEDWKVRSMVASKRKLPEHLQLTLARDSNAGVRGRVVYNAKATVSVLRMLANDEDPDIRAHALERLAAPGLRE
jgi:hypothetical protein